MLRWCWGQRAAGSSLGPGPARYEGLGGQQNIKVECKHDKKMVVCVNGVCIQETCDVDLACQSHIGLAHSAKQSAVVDQPGDTVIYYQFSKESIVQHISINKWA